MAVITDSADKMSLEKVEAQDTFPAGVDIRQGQVININPSTGKWRLAQADTVATVGSERYVAAKTVKANEALTGYLEGVVSYGDALAALDYDDPVYLSDTAGELDDAAGTIPVIVGWVYPDWRNVVAGAPAKILRLAGNNGLAPVIAEDA